MRNSYGRIAFAYDFLSRMIFGDAILESQRYGLHHIRPRSRMLIVGGGTGLILESVSALHPQGLEITYVEISSRMIRLAQRKDAGQNRVEFVHRDIDDFVSTRSYDVVITPFLFDNFHEGRVNQVFRALDGMLKPGGIWLHTDFVHSHRKRHRLLLRMMYLFFGLVSRVEAKRLVDMSPLFEPAYQRVDEQFFYSGFIRASVFRKKV